MVTNETATIRHERMRSQTAYSWLLAYSRMSTGRKLNLTTNLSVDTRLAIAFADHYEQSLHMPKERLLQEAYKILCKEVELQFDFLVASGLHLEPWLNDTPPYQNSSTAMTRDFESGHLFYEPTIKSFGSGITNQPTDHPMLKISAKTGLMLNDMWRVCHDWVHAATGTSFSAQGEWNVSFAHSTILPDAALPALLCELTLQSCAFYFGSQVRRKNGSIPSPSEPDYIALKDRNFPEQKSVCVTSELFNEWLYTRHLWLLS